MKGVILGLLGLFAIEILTWILVAHFISGWWLLWATLIALVVGFNIVRGSFAGLMPQLQQVQTAGQVPANSQMTGAFGKAIAGFLLIFPGLLSDALALIVLIPPVQRKLQVVLMQVFQKRQQAMMQQMMGGLGGQSGMGGFGGMQGMPGFDPAMMEQLMRQMGGGTGMPGGMSRGPTTIDGESRTVESTAKRLGRDAAND